MSNPRIVFPETADERVILAARRLVESGLIHPILLGDAAELAERMHGTEGYTVIPSDPTEFERLAAEAEAKGKSFTVPPELVQAGALVRGGEADGVVAGSVASTADVIRAYLKTVGLAAGITKVTSCFLMERDGERYLFTDCGVNPEPTAEMRAESAYLTAQFASVVGIDPKIAFISFATHASASHPMVSAVAESVVLAKERYPELKIDGPLQVDAAIDTLVAKIKAPDSLVAGNATVLVFPDLNSGNAAYKLTERLGGFHATGPLLLGFAKPAHDLSRGCSVDDIVSAAEIAAKQAQ